MFKNLFNSFSNNPGGWSGRKLSAFVAVMVASYLTIFLLAESDRLHALYAWLTFALVCLGLVTIPELIKFLATVKGTNGASNVTEKTTVEETKETKVS